MGEEGGTRLVFASLVILGGVAGSLWTSILLGHGSLGLFVTDLTFRYINMNPSSRGLFVMYCAVSAKGQ